MRSRNCLWRHSIVIEKTVGRLRGGPAFTSLWNTCLRFRRKVTGNLDKSFCEPFVSKICCTQFLLRPSVCFYLFFMICRVHRSPSVVFFHPPSFMVFRDLRQ